MSPDPRARVQDDRLTVSLPLWQIIVVLGMGVSVIFNNWVTTRELSSSLLDLKRGVNELRRVVEKVDDRTVNYEGRIQALEALQDQRDRR
jgi:hypothetical protein